VVRREHWNKGKIVAQKAPFKPSMMSALIFGRVAWPGLPCSRGDPGGPDGDRATCARKSHLSAATERALPVNRR